MLKLSVFVGAFVCVYFGFTSSVFALRAMDDANDPGRLFSTYENRLSLLPKTGSVTHPIWSDTYWSSRDGGAAARWQLAGTGQPVSPREYGLLPVWQVAQLSDQQLNSLSPAEKYDIALGRFDYPMVKHELARTHGYDPKWYGLCHAVAAVATRFYEPQNTAVNVSMSGGSRRLIFYSSDLKALLALASDRVAEQAVGLGSRCNSTVASSDGACWDTNPASFYISMTNLIGIERVPLIIDVDPLAEVWNAAVKSYTSKISASPAISSLAAPGTVRQVRVDMNVQHTIGAKPSTQPTGGRFKTELYSFTLELDRDDAIIGGEWITKNRPDSLWIPPDQLVVDQHFSYLLQLVRQVQ